MVFSSIAFLYYYFPLLLICYFITPKKYRNYTLLIGSILFYFYAEPIYVFLFLCLSFINYFSALKIENAVHKKYILIVTLSVNFIILGLFKYYDFLIENINLVFSFHASYLHLLMPIGISFFTFQSCSYMLDVYHQKCHVSHKLSEYLLYIMMFPQLIAGPIVRYDAIASQIKARDYSYTNMNQGITRFVCGLAKKVILADTFGNLCEVLLQTTSIGFVGGWMFAIAATFQLYYDFSGYSDMAIGLGQTLGFHLPINFNYPLIATSITDFWKRWHITLSSWFKDYVYIPLGGNRKGWIIQVRNILIVWGLTGLWHGAAWNFVIWGLLFAFVLILEKIWLKTFLSQHPKIGHGYTLCIVFISFTIFRIEDFSVLKLMLSNMFQLQCIGSKEVWYYVQSYAMYFLVAAIGATPWIMKVRKTHHVGYITCIVCVILLLVCTGNLLDGSYHPFLYFRF